MTETELDRTEVTTRTSDCRELFESLPIGVVHVALDGRPMFVNSRAATTLGYDSVDAFLSEVRSVPDLWAHPEERDRAAEILLATGELRDFEVMMKRRDGARLTLSVSANPLRAGDGSVVGLQVSGIDISKQKLVELKLIELNEMKTEFVGVVAHDLASPITVASGYANFLLAQWDDIEDADRRDFLTKIERSLSRLRSLVADVADVTHVELGVARFEKREFDLVQVARSVVEDVTSVEPFPSCELQADDALPTALGDPESIERVIVNLVSNAVKYSGGAAITICVRRAGEMLEVSVHDDGPGILPDEQPRLFRRFSRLASGSAASKGGTGLGLFIAKALVEAGGGKIWLESTPGCGTTFFFSVPIA